MTDLLDYASPAQARYQKMRDLGMSVTAIAEKTGVSERNIKRTLKLLREKAARHGWSPDHGMRHTVPDGFSVKGVSTFYGPEGEINGQWVKSQSDKEHQYQILIERVEEASSAFKKFKPAKPPKTCDSDLASLITITDFHLGMYAWEAESGESWDINIAREVFLNAIHDLIAACPNSGLGILNQLGDFLHFDGMLPITPTGGNVLDADTRYGKLVDLTMDIMAEAVRMMLAKFGEVHVIQAEGNHDMVGSIWLRKHIKHVFADEPRVTVDDTEFPYYAYLHGEIMLGFHHGHKVKLGQVFKLFSSEPRYRAMWGQATQTYIHTGHLHHEKVVEDGGAIAEQHPSLSAKDAYAARGGWQSQRGAKAITYHKVQGEVRRATVRPRPV
jgi:hypothetical protein